MFATVFALLLAALPGADCGMESQDCRLRPEHIGLVNGHITFRVDGDRFARIARAFAPPYFTRGFALDIRLNGETADAASPTYTWTPACVERRGVAGDSWNVTTRTYAIAGERGGIMEVTAQNVHRAARDLSVEVVQSGEAGYCRVWKFNPPDTFDPGRPAAVVCGTTLPGGKTSAAFKAVPNRGVVRFYVAFAVDSPEKAKSVVEAALAAPEQAISAAGEDWNRRWSALLAKVPRFECDDAGLERLYKRSLLHFAMCEWNVDEFVTKPFYATGGMFGSCICSYLWNLGGPYRMWPLVAPDAIKAHVAQYLKLDLTKCYAFSPVDGAPVGPYYQINQEKMMFLIYSYVMETGDAAYLNEIVEGKRIIEHVLGFALLFDDLSKDAVLVDYGARGASHLELRLGFKYDGVMPDMNLRRIALYYLADELCRVAGHDPGVDLVARAKALKALCREKLWDPRAGWFSGTCSDGVRTTRWTMQMFKALGWRGKVLDKDQEDALVGHLMNKDEFLGRYGVHSLSKKDIAYHAQDVDNGGPGACPSFAPAIVNRLYRDGRTMEGDKIFMRLKWLADCFPYWSDSQYADRMDYRHNTPLQLNIEGGCLAQTIVFGLFGVEVGVDMKPVFRPHLPKGVSRMSLRGLRLCGSSYDVAVDGSGTVVKSRGKAVRK